MNQKRDNIFNLVAANLVLLTVAYGMSVIDRYHGGHSGHLIYVQLCFMSAASAISALISNRSKSNSCASLFSRLPVIAALAAWVWFAILNGAVSSRPNILEVRIGPLHVAAACAVCLLFVRRLSADRWTQLRRAAVAGIMLFAALPALWAYVAAPDLHWPTQSLDRGQRDSREAVLFVLLDELNSSEIGSFESDLRALGLNTRSKAVPSVGDSTAKTIPAMFSGSSFDQAKACSSSAICSGKNILDFGRISVQSRDVDVVGMHHPYCRMSGLRYCERPPFSLDLFDGVRWTCAASRLLRLRQATDCAGFSVGAWSRFAEDMERALWAAPIWKQGGLLFAHLPYPHPPGQSSSHSLTEDYASNVARARTTVGSMVRRLKSENIEHIHVVIFSDHPLRINYWCSTSTYSGRCGNTKSIQDSLTPLMVASTGPAPSLQKMENNGKVFELAAAFER